MNSETKNTSINSVQACQNCKNDFVIEREDFDFYAKIKVPPPTFCPECRLQRRLVWMKGLQLFKRKCDLCGEMKFSMYHPDAPYVVYCDRCWWGDGWDPSVYEQDYDPTQPFFEQWNKLLHRTPVLGLSIDKETGQTSPFTNHVGWSKNCYLIFYSAHNEDSMYGYYLKQAKNVVDCSPLMNSENCYDSGNIFKCFNVYGSHNVRNDIDSYFLNDCDNCTNCFASACLRNKSYVFLNEQLSKEQYQEKMKDIDLGSYKNYCSWKAQAHEHWKNYPPKPSYDDFSVDSTGSYYFYSKNCKECYEVVGGEDSKYLMLIKEGKVKDSYDYTDWGYNADLVYDSMTVGEDVHNVKFTHESGHGIHDIEYSKLSVGAGHHFGCVSMKKKNYCILNKEYSKEEYEKLRTQIIKDMTDTPYVSVMGHQYVYGEFFPPEFSPWAYNDSFASRFFPLKKEKVLSSGLAWYEPEEKEYAVTIKAVDLPDHIVEATIDVTKEIISCAQCNRGFRIIPAELQFLKAHNLPLPRQCPFCRIWEKIDVWIENMRLHDRVCDKCGTKFKTHYSKERAPIVYCKTCYQQEVA